MRTRYCKLRTFALALWLLTPLVVAQGATREKRGPEVERSVAAGPRVVVSACTLSGGFTVRGWDRNEVRVRSDGADIELTRIDQTKSEQATELKVTSKTGRSNARNSCLMYGGLEIDVPRGGSIRLQTTSGDISVTDLARANVLTTSGSISLTKMREETQATVIGGDISVRDSAGLFSIHATGGSIDARRLTAVAPSDTVTVSTVSGEVTLNDVTHQRVNVNTVSGEVLFSGEVLRNGSYNFQNLSGEIHLMLPASSSFRLVASVGETVKINSDFNLNYTQNQNVTGRGNRGEPQRVSATVGTGESSIRVSLMSGSLRISKR